MTLPDLTPDCRHCDALCCVLLAFDASEAFAFDKPACMPCRHLTGNRCDIHAGLAEKGFSGCVRFDCHGAGQRLTGQVFRGRSWRDDPALLPAMDQAFRALRQVHEAMVLLQAAAPLPLTQAQERRRLSLLADLATDRDEAALNGPQTALQDARTFLASLRDAVTPPRP